MFQPMALTMRAALCHAELEMVLALAHHPRLAHDPDLAGQQQRPGIADAVRLEPLDLFDHAEREHSQRDLGVDGSTFCNCSGVRSCSAAFLEVRGERFESGPVELQPGGGLVAAEGDQARGAIADRLVQVEARRSSGPSPG